MVTGLKFATSETNEPKEAEIAALRSWTVQNRLPEKRYVSHGSHPNTGYTVTSAFRYVAQKRTRSRRLEQSDGLVSRHREDKKTKCTAKRNRGKVFAISHPA